MYQNHSNVKISSRQYPFKHDGNIYSESMILYIPFTRSEFKGNNLNNIVTKSIIQSKNVNNYINRNLENNKLVICPPLSEFNNKTGKC